MTKEKLIALSDLNREDNIKYISSEAQGIAITLDSDRYASNLCKLERAYICGRRKSEEQIEQLEKENVELKKKCYKKAVKDYCDLEKENAELKETLKTYNGCGDWDNDFHTCRVYLQHEELQKCIEQLTKAKELLKEWMQTSKASSCDNINIVTNTEQFLKDN